MPDPNAYGPPLTKTAIIDLDGYLQAQREYREQDKNPLSPNFSWLWWLGLKTQQDIDEATEKYNEIANLIPRDFYRRKDGGPINTGAEEHTPPTIYINDTFDRLIREGHVSSSMGEIYKSEFTVFLSDFMNRRAAGPCYDQQVDLNGPDQKFDYAPQVKDMFFRILFVIYSKIASSGMWYGSMEGGYLYDIWLIVSQNGTLITNHQQQPLHSLGLSAYRKDGLQISQEVFLYRLYLKLFIKSELKSFLVPSGRIKASPFAVSVMDARRTQTTPTPGEFLKWLLVVLMIKKNKAGFSVLINYDAEDRNGVFSTLINRFSTWVGGNCPPMSGCISFEDIKKIWGNLLVSGDIKQFFAYLISFWCSYLPNISKWDNAIKDDTQTREAIQQGELENAIDFYLMVLRVGQTAEQRRAGEIARGVYNHDIPENTFRVIYNYFKGAGKKDRFGRTSGKKGNFEKLVLLCTESFQGRNRHGEAEFSLPVKFINSNAIWAGDGDDDGDGDDGGGDDDDGGADEGYAKNVPRGEGIFSGEEDDDDDDVIANRLSPRSSGRSGVEQKDEDPRDMIEEKIPDSGFPPQYKRKRRPPTAFMDATEDELSDEMHPPRRRKEKTLKAKKKQPKSTTAKKKPRLTFADEVGVPMEEVHSVRTHYSGMTKTQQKEEILKLEQEVRDGKLKVKDIAYPEIRQEVEDLLTDINAVKGQHPATLRAKNVRIAAEMKKKREAKKKAGGGKRKRKKRRKKCKTLKKSNRKLNRTIKLR